MNALQRAIEILPIKMRKFIKINYPNLWKLLLNEADDFDGRVILWSFILEIVNVMKCATIPTMVGLVSVFFGFIPYAPTWIAVIIMVHYLTSTLHHNEFQESLVSPRFWIRFLADIFIGTLGYYLHAKSILPSNQLDFSNYAKACVSLIVSCLTTSLEDFGFYRVYLSFMRAVAVTYRMLHPNEKQWETDHDDLDQKDGYKKCDDENEKKD